MVWTDKKARRPGNDSAAPVSAGCGVGDLRLVTSRDACQTKIPSASNPLQICELVRLDQKC